MEIDYKEAFKAAMDIIEEMLKPDMPGFMKAALVIKYHRLRKLE